MKKSVCKSCSVARAPGVSLSGGCDIVHQPGFPVLKIGSRMVVPKGNFLCWVKEHTGGAG